MAERRATPEMAESRQGGGSGAALGSRPRRRERSGVGVTAKEAGAVGSRPRRRARRRWRRCGVGVVASRERSWKEIFEEEVKDREPYGDSPLSVSTQSPGPASDYAAIKPPPLLQPLSLRLLAVHQPFDSDSPAIRPPPLISGDLTVATRQRRSAKAVALTLRPSDLALRPSDLACIRGYGP
ncbi:uncharacterized protein A4U43_C08F23160 [Asparagus officinalis]|nr:uncharacterized protein A4U43_C08F23160 [Asparagus officinalis]